MESNENALAYGSSYDADHRGCLESLPMLAAPSAGANIAISAVRVGSDVSSDDPASSPIFYKHFNAEGAWPVVAGLKAASASRRFPHLQRRSNWYKHFPP